MIQYRSKVVFALAVATAVMAGLVGCRAQTSSQTAAPQTAVVQRGSVTAAVSTAGTVAANAQVGLAFQTSGQVIQIPAQVGQQVKAGQVLAKLDTTDLELALQQAQVNLATAKTNLAKTQAGPTPQDVASARAGVGNAAAAYQAAAAKNNLNSAQLTVARAQLDKAAAALQRAQLAYDWHAHDWLDPMPQNSQQATDLTNAETAYQLAQAAYNQSATDINSSPVTAAAAQLAQAQYTLDNLLRTPSSQDLVIAQGAVTQAQAGLTQAQVQLAKATLPAPFDGTVADVNVQVGQTVSSGTQAVLLADLSQLDVAVTLAETDVPNVKVGQEAEVTLDAIPGVTYSGQVDEVDLVGTTTSGVVNYPVTVVITNANSDIKPGMNANVSIIVARHDNVLLVPNRAVRTVGQTHQVTVLYQGQQIVVPVTVGISSDTQTEILSGLREGDVVLIGTTTAPTGGGPGGGPGVRIGG